MQPYFTIPFRKFHDYEIQYRGHVTWNYQLVSLTPAEGNLLESVIPGSIHVHIEKHNIIHDSRHRFSKGRSCITDIVSFYTEVIEATDRDFSKAFNNVPRLQLLSELRGHGLDEKVFNSVKPWLDGRKKRGQIQFNSISYELLSVTSGVPQRSVLAPLLFTIYISDGHHN